MDFFHFKGIFYPPFPSSAFLSYVVSLHKKDSSYAQLRLFGAIDGSQVFFLSNRTVHSLTCPVRHRSLRTTLVIINCYFHHIFESSTIDSCITSEMGSPIFVCLWCLFALVGVHHAISSIHGPLGLHFYHCYLLKPLFLRLSPIGIWDITCSDSINFLLSYCVALHQSLHLSVPFFPRSEELDVKLFCILRRDLYIFMRNILSIYSPSYTRAISSLGT